MRMRRHRLACLGLAVTAAIVFLTRVPEAGAVPARASAAAASPSISPGRTDEPLRPGASSSSLDSTWLLAMLALAFAGAGLLAGETFRCLDPAARSDPRAIATAVASARSRLAVPLALLGGIAFITLGAMLRR